MTAAAGAGAGVAATVASYEGGPATSSTHTDLNVPVDGVAVHDQSATTTNNEFSNRTESRSGPAGTTEEKQDVPAPAPEPISAPDATAQTGGQAPKPKKKRFFFCCGNPADLD